MAEGKKSFVLYTNYIDLLDGYEEDGEHIEGMTDEEAGKWIKTIFRYVNDREFTIPNEIRQAFILVRKDLKQDLKKYQAKVLSMENARKSNRNHIENKLKSISNQLEINSDNVIVNDNDNVNDNVDIYNDISLKEENDRIDALQKLIQEIEILFGRTLVKDKKDIVIKMYDDFGYDKTLSTIKNYKDKNDAIKYANTVLHNLTTPKEEKQTEMPKQINSWMDAWKISQDETAPQYLRDEALEYLDKH